MPISLARAAPPTAAPSNVPPAAGLSGKKWIAASSFVNKNDPEAFKTLSARLDSALDAWKAGKGPQPVLIFDIDQTLYGNRLRQQMLLRDLACSDVPMPDALRSAMAQAKAKENWFGLEDMIESLHFSLQDPAIQAALPGMNQFYINHLLSPEGVANMAPYAFAKDYVNQCLAKGAKVVYLTGRSEVPLGPPTRRRLTLDGFPLGGNASLVLKQDPAQSDPDFKRQALDAIAQQGVVVATFDNEPGNVAVYAQRFPQAANVFYEIACSRAPAQPQKNLLRIHGWPNPQKAPTDETNTVKPNGLSNMKAMDIFSPLFHRHPSTPSTNEPAPLPSTPSQARTELLSLVNDFQAEYDPNDTDADGYVASEDQFEHLVTGPLGQGDLQVASNLLKNAMENRAFIFGNDLPGHDKAQNALDDAARIYDIVESQITKAG